MRIFETPEVAINPQRLWRELLSQPGAASATPDLVRAINRHVNLTGDVPANTVLLIPNAADLKAGAGTPVGAQELDELAGDIATGLKAIATRVAAGVKQAEADHAAVTSALKVATTKRLVESDPQVKKQLESADAAFKADQKHARDQHAQLAEIQKLALSEFARLRGMLVG